MRKAYLLEMLEICKSFPGVKALDNAELKIEAGTVHALMGENGAGKSTLMKCLFGIYSADSGKILFDGSEFIPETPKKALEQGIAMVHQELNQALKRTVADNVWLGRYPKKLGFITSNSVLYKKTEELFESLEIKINPRAIMSTLSVSKRQMVEIAKAVSYNSKIIVLDEPTSSLNEKEAEQLFAVISKLKARGCGIIYISHKMDEILKISDSVTVMRDGKHVATNKSDDLSIDKIISLMVGRELKNIYPKKENAVGNTVLEVENLSARHGVIKNVSFELKEGEIVGVAGLDGSGRTDLLETVFGLMTKEHGTIKMDGIAIDNKSPAEAIKNGFALITEERRETGIFSNLSITDNTVISSVKKHRLPMGFISEKKMKDDTSKMISSLKIKTPSTDTKIAVLSGGNQQKVILSRWLLTNPRFLLLDEPTRGIDVGAKYEIYQLIINLAKEGRSVLMVSGEMPELLGICDRIIVLSAGRVAGEVSVKSTSQEEIMSLAAKFL